MGNLQIHSDQKHIKVTIKKKNNPKPTQYMILLESASCKTEVTNTPSRRGQAVLLQKQ